VLPSVPLGELWDSGSSELRLRLSTRGEIAARLSVSRRTMETHLYRVYTKLGVSGRRGLGPLLSGHAAQQPD